MVAAAIETIERIGPCDAQIEVERIEDVRGSKRDYILERAKKLMGSIEGSSDSREIANEIKVSKRTSDIQSYGTEKLPCGDLSGDEVIVVEGRADVVNLLKAGVKNVIAMNGTKLPDAIKELGRTKEITLFVDGDRGGKLIAQNAVDNANVKYITSAPDGKEVEELTGKEILMNLRKKVPAHVFLGRRAQAPVQEVVKTSELKLGNSEKEKLKEISAKNQGSGKAILLDANLETMKNVSARTLTGTLRRMQDKPAVLVIDATVTSSTLKAAEEAGVQAIAAKNFATTETSIQLLSL